MVAGIRRGFAVGPPPNVINLRRGGEMRLAR